MHAHLPHNHQGRVPSTLQEEDVNGQVPSCGHNVDKSVPRAPDDVSKCHHCRLQLKFQKSNDEPMRVIATNIVDPFVFADLKVVVHS